MTLRPARCPKLLVVSAFAPNEISGGGALSRQLLRDFPSDQLLWWSYRPGTDLGQNVQRHFCFPIPPSLQSYVRLTRTRSWLLEHTWVRRAAAHLRRTVEDLQPDAIWSLPWGWLIPVLAASGLHRERRCHTSVWDYADTRSHRGVLGEKRSTRHMEMLYDLFRTAYSGDAISAPMLADLQARTNRRDGAIVHSGLEPEHLARLSAGNAPPASQLRIAYAGTIVVPETFHLFRRAVDNIRSRLPRPVSLEFFGGRRYQKESWFNPGWMRERGHLDEAQFEAELGQCSWGFLPMDLTGDDPRYNRFSLPNKFGTYLSAGLPILGLTHGDSSAAHVLRTHRVGRMTDHNNLAGIEQFVVEVLQEPDSRAGFRAEILRCGQTEFNAAKMRETLWAAWARLKD